MTFAINMVLDAPQKLCAPPQTIDAATLREGYSNRELSNLDYSEWWLEYKPSVN